MILVKWLAKQRLILVCVVVLLALGIGLWVFFAKNREGQDSAAVETALTSAEEQTTSGNYEQALQTLKDAEQNAKTNKEKIRVLNDLAAAAANAGQLEAALTYYDQKHKLDPASKKSDGYLVGELYERLDQQQKAVDAFQEYLDYLKSLPSDEFVEAKIASVTDRIQAVQGSQ